MVPLTLSVGISYHYRFSGSIFLSTLIIGTNHFRFLSLPVLITSGSYHFRFLSVLITDTLSVLIGSYQFLSVLISSYQSLSVLITDMLSVLISSYQCRGLPPTKVTTVGLFGISILPIL